jgi:hypothetical protein
VPSETVTISAAWSSQARRHISECPLCGYSVSRSKREAALHVMSQHVTYEHGREVEEGKP